MKIKDENGRIGIVVDQKQRESGEQVIFAKPQDVPDLVEAEQYVGIAGEVMTATAWYYKEDGETLSGLWYDSPFSKFTTAKILED